MVVIRLARAGSKKRPFYPIIVTDKRNKRDCGNYIERIGYYNPIAKGQEIPFTIDLEKYDAWQAKGAQASDRLSQLVKQFKKAKAA